MYTEKRGDCTIIYPFTDEPVDDDLFRVKVTHEVDLFGRVVLGREEIGWLMLALEDAVQIMQARRGGS